MDPLLDRLLSGGAQGSCGIKVCGFRHKENLLACFAAGAHAVGLNFWPRSKRFVDAEEVVTWLPGLPQDGLRIGVFVNASLDEIRRLRDRGLIHAAQLHGDESPEDCQRLREDGLPVLKALGVKDAASLETLDAFEVEAFVLDAFCPGDYGGSGKTFDWELALRAKERRPDTPLILSGGLTPENVGDAVARVRPHAVDVASGVETAPGVKSEAKVRAFVEAVERVR